VAPGAQAFLAQPAVELPAVGMPVSASVSDKASSRSLAWRASAGCRAAPSAELALALQARSSAESEQAAVRRALLDDAAPSTAGQFALHRRVRHHMLGQPLADRPARGRRLGQPTWTAWRNSSSKHAAAAARRSGRTGREVVVAQHQSVVGVGWRCRHGVERGAVQPLGRRSPVSGG
jgi:hypothetical protein